MLLHGWLFFFVLYELTQDQNVHQTDSSLRWELKNTKGHLWSGTLHLHFLLCQLVFFKSLSTDSKVHSFAIIKAIIYYYLYAITHLCSFLQMPL